MILLVALNSQYIHTSPVLYALKRGAEAVGCAGSLSVLEFSINMPRVEIMRRICEQRPSVIAFSAYIWNIDFIRLLLDDLALLLPQTLLLLGGPEASARARYYLAQTPAEGVCVGEGEESFPALIQALDRGESRPTLPGWMWKGREDDYRPAPEPDLARLPFLYTDEEGRRIKSQGRVVYYEASRGCPYACSFCCSAGQRLRERPMDLVLSELPRLAAMGGQIKLVDRSFNADPKRAAILCRAMARLHHSGLSWHLEIEPGCLTPELVRIWREAPADCFRLEMGVQTLNPRALAAVGRRNEWDQAEPLVRELLAAGVHLHLDLIAGLPEDDPDNFAASFHHLHQLSPDYLQLGFLKVLPGSPLAAQAGRRGLVYSPHPPYRVLSTPTMDGDWLGALALAERAFNALYNKGDRYRQRPLLIEKARAYPGGALDMYFRAGEMLPEWGLNAQDKQEILNKL